MRTTHGAMRSTAAFSAVSSRDADRRRRGQCRGKMRSASSATNAHCRTAMLRYCSDPLIRSPSDRLQSTGCRASASPALRRLDLVFPIRSAAPVHDCTNWPLTNTIRSSARMPALAAGESGRTLSINGGVRSSTLGTSTIPRSPSVSGFSAAFGGPNAHRRGGLPGFDRFHSLHNFVHRHGVVQPTVVLRVAQLQAQHAQQFAAQVGKRSPAAPGLLVMASSTYTGPWYGVS